MGFISGKIYMLHKFIVTRVVNEYDDLDTEGMFLLCPGNLEENKTALYVQTAEAYWLKWPVNIDECMIFMSVKGHGSYFGKPRIYVDEKGRHCFDTIGLLKEKNIGYVSTNEYASHARVEYSTTHGHVCSGGMWQYYGKKGGPGTLTILCADSHLLVNERFVYKIEMALEYNAFVKNPDLRRTVTDFLDEKRDITRTEMVDFFRELPVTSECIEYYASDSYYNKENVRDIYKMSGLDLSSLVLCDSDKGVLLLLNGRKDYGIPSRLIFHDGRKEMAIQAMINPYEDYIVYKDMVSGREIIEKTDQFMTDGNLIRIDVNQWLSKHDIDYTVQPFKDNKDVFGKDYNHALYQLGFTEGWQRHIEQYQHFTIEEKFKRYSFIYLKMEEPKNDTVRAIYIGSTFEQALQRLLGEFEINRDIKQKLTEKLLLKGTEFCFDARRGKGTGYVKLMASYGELLAFAEVMGIKEYIVKKYTIKSIEDLMTEFFITDME